MYYVFIKMCFYNIPLYVFVAKMIYVFWLACYRKFQTWFLIPSKLYLQPDIFCFLCVWFQNCMSENLVGHLQNILQLYSLFSIVLFVGGHRKQFNIVGVKENSTIIFLWRSLFRIINDVIQSYKNLSQLLSATELINRVSLFVILFLQRLFYLALIVVQIFLDVSLLNNTDVHTNKGNN